MMLIEPLQIRHRALLIQRLQILNLPISEYSFSNLYLFRKVHDYHLIQGEELYLRGQTRDHFSFLMPLLSINQWNWEEVYSLLADVDCLFPISEEWEPSFDKKFFLNTYVDADSDYLYSLDKIRTYPGRHLDGKRNLVTQFKERYKHASFDLTTSRIKDALFVLNTWKEEINEEDLCQTDYCACSEALECLDKLYLMGKIYYAGELPVGFILGEQVSSGVFAIHFAKADKNIKGAYQFMFQDFALSLPNQIAHLNFEQDLGIPALRSSKQSYLPDRLVKKLRFFLKHLI